MFPFPLHCGFIAEVMPSTCLEGLEAVQVREQGLTKAFQCMNCFIDCKGFVPSLASLTSPFPASGFSTSSISGKDLTSQVFLEVSFLQVMFRLMESSGWGSLGEDVLALLEGDHGLFQEDILAMMMSGDCLWVVQFHGLSFLITLCGTLGLLPPGWVKPFYPAQSFCVLIPCSSSAYPASSRALSWAHSLWPHQHDLLS